jgi:exodeoxyribonuclease VII small subunit
MGAVSATSPAPDAAGVDELSYEQARDELVAVVSRLEAGGATLEESLTLWERGEALAARCQQWLDGARARLDAARDADGDGPVRPGGGEDAPG